MAYYPGSAHVFTRALVENPRQLHNDDSRVIYDCTLPCTNPRSIIRGSFSHQTFSATPSLQRGIYDIHAKVIEHRHPYQTRAHVS